MRLAPCACALVLAAVLLLADGKKVFTGRRKSGGSGKANSPRRGGSPQKTPPASAPARPDSSSHFLAAERGAGAPGGSGVHDRQAGLFQRKPEQPAPQTNGPIGFERVNAEAQRKPGPPAYPGGPPQGPPPAYNPGYGHGPPAAGAPPAYPGRPVGAPPAYPGHAGYQQSAYPQQAYPGGGQQNLGYPNAGYHSPGPNFGYPNQGYPGSNFGHPNQGFGSYPGNSYQGGFGGSPYGGSPFGHSNPMGGNSYGYGNAHYGSNDFRFGGSPGLFGGGRSSGFGGLGGGLGGGLFGGGHSNYGYHKRSRFGGLPIPIPIPIPIPMGLFGGWGGGHSRSHRELDTFLRNRTVDPADNATASVYVLNNSTVAPCTTDQFVYGSLNVTVVTCTAGNCTAIKAFVATNASGEAGSRSAGLTMCLEADTTFSSFSDNTNPRVSDLHKYWMKVCKELVWSGAAGDASDPAGNVTVKVSEVVLNETLVKIDNTTEQVPIPATANASPEGGASNSSGEDSTKPISTQVPLPATTTASPEGGALNSTKPSSPFCDVFDCSWIEMCLPPVEVAEPCSPPKCDSAKMIHNPCVRIKMCRSPTTPVSTFATFNNSITRVDPGGDVMQANDVANLTVISFVPPSAPANCSEDSGDASCKARSPSGASEKIHASESPLEVSESSPAGSDPSEVATKSSLSSSNSSEVLTESSPASSSASDSVPEASTVPSVETSLDHSGTPLPS